MAKRVVITGMGAVTPIGNSVTELWDSVENSKIGIDLITRFDLTDFKVSLAAEVKSFDAEKYIPKKETKRMDLYSQFAMYAASQAMEDSGLTEDIYRDNTRVGVMVGSAIGGLGTIEQQVTRLNEKGPAKVSPFFVPMAISNMGAGNIAIKYGLTGVCTSVVTACATSTNCIGEAFRNIKHGYSDVILAGGAEACITRIGIAGFNSLTAVTQSDNPQRASIPFDAERNGFVMGEGGGVLVLEELEHAKKRNAKIYGEVVGYGSTCDAYHMTSPKPTGESAAAAMLLAVEEAGIDKNEISYINAHGTSTVHNDLPETAAIKKAFGDFAYEIPVSSSKSMFGHLLGAAGAVEAIVCVQALIHGFVPPTVGLETPGEGCDLNYVPQKGFHQKLNYALSNSFGFGGHNVVICLKKWEG